MKISAKKSMGINFDAILFLIILFFCQILFNEKSPTICSCTFANYFNPCM